MELDVISYIKQYLTLESWGLDEADYEDFLERLDNPDELGWCLGVLYGESTLNKYEVKKELIEREEDTDIILTLDFKDLGLSVKVTGGYIIPLYTKAMIWDNAEYSICKYEEVK